MRNNTIIMNNSKSISAKNLDDIKNLCLAKKHRYFPIEVYYKYYNSQRVKKVSLKCNKHFDINGNDYVFNQRIEDLRKLKLSRKCLGCLSEIQKSNRQLSITDLREKIKYSKNLKIKENFHVIEFDGEQHFKPLKIFGGKKKFFSQIRNDVKKNIYCFRNKINLLRIPYFEYNNIENLVNQAIHKISNEDLTLKRNTPIFYKVSYISFIANKRRKK